MFNFNTVDRDDTIKINVTNIDDSNCYSIQFDRCVLCTAGATRTSKIGDLAKLESVRERVMSHRDHRNAQYFTMELLVTTRLFFFT